MWLSSACDSPAGREAGPSVRHRERERDSESEQEKETERKRLPPSRFEIVRY